MKQDQETQLMTAEKAFYLISHCGNLYPKMAVDYILAHREEALPLLRQAIRDVVSSSDRIYTDAQCVGFSFALHFLSVFRDSAVHQEILQFLRWDDKTIDRLIEWMLTEDMPMILHKTCDGSYEGIWELAMDQSADEYCRSAATNAMVYGVYQNEFSKEILVKNVVQNLEKNLAEPVEHCDFKIIDSLVSVLYYLGESNALPLLKRLSPICSPEELEELEYAIQELETKPEEYFSETLPQCYNFRDPKDFYDRVKWWNAFSDVKEIAV